MADTRAPRSSMGAYRFISLDYQAGVATLARLDGRVARFALPTTEIADSMVTRTTFHPAESVMEIVAAGHTVTMKLGTSQGRLPGPCVYLDQRDWIDFARWEKGPENVTPAKRPFFDMLAQASAEERVVLPLSGAHLMETSKRGGTSRVDLASTMLRHSRGWQMRSVAALRRAELRALFGGEALTRPEIITLAPEAALDMGPQPPMASDRGREDSDMFERLVWATVLTDLLMDSNPTPSQGRELAQQWAQSFAPLAEAIPGNGKAKARLRDLTRGRFTSDLGNELPAAARELGWSEDAWADWLKNSAESAFAASPGLGRMREVLHLRVSNANECWEANDLNDWLHLSFAAGYLDLVLGERKTINYLRRAAPRTTSGAALHFRAKEAVDDLVALLT